MRLHDTIDVLIGGYLSRDAAEEDYNAVRNCSAHLHGAVVVSKDLEGNLSAEQTDHMVREGAEGLGAIGLTSTCSRRRCSPRPRSVRRWAQGPASSCTTRRARS
jgi:hypothetical protein